MTEDSLDLAQKRVSMMGFGQDQTGEAGLVGSPLQSMIHVEFETAALPSPMVTLGRFVSVMQQRVAMRLGDRVQGLRDRTDGSDEMTLTQFDRLIPVTLTFEDGRVEYDRDGRRKLAQIASVRLTGGGDVIEAIAFGDTRDAEAAIGRTYECLWEAAGSPRNYSEHLDAVHALGYVTQTLEELDLSFDKILAPGLAAFLAELSNPADGLASRMGTRPVDKSTGKAVDIEASTVTVLDNLSFEIRVNDLSTNVVEKAVLRLAPKTKRTTRQGTYNVTSHLPFEEHERLVIELRRHLG